MTKQKKILVEVFPKANLYSNMVGCGCGCGPSFVMPTVMSATSLEDIIAQFSSENTNEVEVKVNEYATENAKAAAIEALNRVLEASNEGLRVTKGNLETVLFQAGPIVAIDGYIAFVQQVPTNEQLTDALRQVQKTSIV